MDDVLNVKQLDEIEAQLSKCNIHLKNRVGLATFEWVKTNFGNISRILVVIGNGRSASYALSLLEYLVINAYSVEYFCIHKNINSSPQLSDSILNKCLNTIPDDLRCYDLIVDGIYDVLTEQNISSHIFDIIQKINNNANYILSLESPSGINQFTGKVTLPAINANMTLTFISDKAGLHTGDGIDYSGQVLVVNLVDLTRFNLQSTSCVIKFNSLSNINYHTLIRHKLNTSKGSYGTVAIIGGNKGMSGALYLAGQAALMTGSGKVVLVPLDNDFRLDFTMPELMVSSFKDLISNLSFYDALAIGPGFGSDKRAVKIIHELLDVIGKVPVVVDADALNLIAAHESLQQKFKLVAHNIITPHPGEASRILKTNISVIQNNRFEALKEISVALATIVVLKGAGTLIGNANNIYINITGNPGLANAGQSDTLTGIIVGLLALGLDLMTAARFGVYIHGAAGDRLFLQNHGYHGIHASDVAHEICVVLNDLLYGDLFKD